MKITDVSIARPVFTSMMAIGAMVIGGMAYSRLGVDLFPEMSFPVAVVNTVYPGASPESVEKDVTKVIEEAVSAIGGVDSVRSYSRESVSTVIVMFKLDADNQKALSDVRDRVAQVRMLLPRDTRDPVVSRIDPTALPVATYSVSAPGPSLVTRQIGEKEIKAALERVDGVGSVGIIGGDVRELRAELERDKLETNGVTVVQVAMAIGAESYDLPGGRMTVGSREFSLKTVGRFRTPEEVGEVVLRAHANGAMVRVRDVARIIDGVKERRTVTRVNGTEAILLEVRKQSGSNAIAVVDACDKIIEKTQSQLPEGMQVVKVIDSSAYSRSNMRNMQEALIEGGLLAILVIFLFMLDWRSTLISAVALPISVVATFGAMWWLGFSLNIMSMMGLSLAIGLLIDDSIVVRENIYKYLERGEDPITAAQKGTSEIALAVMATTFTIVAVFGPVAFTGGLVGMMFKQFGLTVTVAVLVSLLVSFTVDPMMSARIVQKFEPDHHEKLRRHRLLGPIARFHDAVDGYYQVVLAWSLTSRKTVALLATMLFAGSLGLTALMGQEFAGRPDQGDFTLNVELAAGSSLAETERMAVVVEKLVWEEPEVQTVVTTIGPDEEVSKVTFRVKARSKDERERSLSQVMETLRPRLTAVPGLIFNMREAGLTGSSSALEPAPVTLEIKGPDFVELTRLSEAAYGMGQATFGIRDLTSSYRPGSPEQRFVIDRKRAADLGVSFGAVAGTLRTAVEGEAVTKFRQGEFDYDVRVQLRPEDRSSLEQVQLLSVPTGRGGSALLRDVTTLEQSFTPATIERVNRQRQIAITANVSGSSLGEVIDDYQARLDTLRPPPGYSLTFGGEAERMKETFSSLGLVMVLAVILIYLVLASQFESIIHPLTIMVSLPLAIVGALMFLFVTNLPMGMPAMIGIILLMGLVTKNAILLVDHANHARVRGMEIIPALMEAGRHRLRPILMTSVAMVLGMLPTALRTGEGSEIRAPMSVAVIGGVVVSTALTLVVVPVVYVWFDRFTLRGMRERRKAAVVPVRAAAPSAGVTEA